MNNYIKKSYIDNGNAFDWGKASQDYAKFRDIYPPVFYEKLLESGIGTKGQRLLDIGTGTGVLPRNMYKYTEDVLFTASDISENQIAQARRLSAESNMDINYIVSPAEELNLPDNTFDAVTACQCYIYLDKSVIFKNIHRMLKPNGNFCIMFMAWLIEESDIAATTEQIVRKHNPDWTDHSVKRFIYDFPSEAEGLFKTADSFHYDLPVTFTRESWHGRIRACRGIGASSLTQSQIAEFEKEHLEYLQSVPPTFDIPHFVTMLNLIKI